MNIPFILSLKLLLSSRWAMMLPLHRNVAKLVLRSTAVLWMLFNHFDKIVKFPVLDICAFLIYRELKILKNSGNFRYFLSKLCTLTPISWRNSKSLCFLVLLSNLKDVYQNFGLTTKFFHILANFCTNTVNFM